MEDLGVQVSTSLSARTPGRPGPHLLSCRRRESKHQRQEVLWDSELRELVELAWASAPHWGMWTLWVQGRAGPVGLRVHLCRLRLRFEALASGRLVNPALVRNRMPAAGFAERSLLADA